jgi:hypothetical protein
MGLITYLTITAAGGVLVRALARLLPGPDPMTLLETMLVGLGGSFAAGLTAHLPRLAGCWHRAVCACRDGDRLRHPPASRRRASASVRVASIASFEVTGSPALPVRREALGARLARSSACFLHSPRRRLRERGSATAAHVLAWIPRPAVAGVAANGCDRVQERERYPLQRLSVDQRTRRSVSTAAVRLGRLRAPSARAPRRRCHAIWPNWSAGRVAHGPRRVWCPTWIRGTLVARWGESPISLQERVGDAVAVHESTAHGASFC